MEFPASSIRRESADLSIDLELEREFLEPTYNDEVQDDPNRPDYAFRDTALIEPLRDISPFPIHLDGPMVASLPQWIQEQASTHETNAGRSSSNSNSKTVAKVKVAYAISKLLEHIKVAVSNYSQAELHQLCSLENFSVHTFHDMFSGEDQVVVGVDMISPYMSVQFVSSQEIAVTRHCDFCCATKAMNRDDNQRDDHLLCYSFGVLLYNLFCGQDNLTEDKTMKPPALQELDRHDAESPPAKKSICGTCTPSLLSFTTTSVSRLVNSLLDCQLAAEIRPEDAYTSLEVAIGDLELLLKEPSVFLFDYENRCLKRDSCKLYGRTEEVSVLSETFFRVACSGKSEAIMIGGYSG
jgi:hypothetical protein